jgi:hypothetical protein
VCVCVWKEGGGARAGADGSGKCVPWKGSRKGAERLTGWEEQRAAADPKRAPSGSLGCVSEQPQGLPAGADARERAVVKLLPRRLSGRGSPPCAGCPHIQPAAGNGGAHLLAETLLGAVHSH